LESMSHHGDGGGHGHQQAALLWPRAAVDALLFSLLHDPSIKVRRAAIRLVSLVVLPAGGDGAARLTKTLLKKLRDKDALVSDRALQLLVQLPPALIITAVNAPEPNGGGRIGESGWSALMKHCIGALAAAAAVTADLDCHEFPKSGLVADADAGGSGGALSDRTKNYVKLLRAILRTAAEETVAATAAAGGAKSAVAPPPGQLRDPLGTSPNPHPLEILLLPMLAGDVSEIDTAVAVMQRAEAVATAAAAET
ncbi:hypothetical protein Vretifemale_17043, partial [Volvox reticuliferus]